MARVDAACFGLECTPANKRASRFHSDVAGTNDSNQQAAFCHVIDSEDLGRFKTFLGNYVCGFKAPHLHLFNFYFSFS